MNGLSELDGAIPEGEWSVGEGPSWSDTGLNEVEDEDPGLIAG